jgi:hypothetical protein
MTARSAAAALALAGSLILVPALTAAQVTPPPGGQRHRMELERRLHAGFGRVVQNRLGLGQDQLVALQGVMMSFQEDRMALNQAKAVLRFRLREPALQGMQEPDARTLLQEMIRLQEQELELYRREQDQLLQVLTPIQLVRFYSLRENLGQQVLELRQGRGLGRGPGGGGPGGISGGPGDMDPQEYPQSGPGGRRFFR